MTAQQTPERRGLASRARARIGVPRIPVSVPAATILAFSAPGLLVRRARRAGSEPPRTRRPDTPRPKDPRPKDQRPEDPRPEDRRPEDRRPRNQRPRSRRPRIRPGTVAALLTWAVTGVTLFAVYLHVARTAAVTADGASNALQAWDMLHGNPLLRGWQLSDVSFYPTELAQYMLIERLRGLSPDVVHVAGAMTYTLLALLAALLAKGRATGREAVVRCVLAIGIMAAPQAGDGIYVLMGSPDHIGSTIPVMVTFLLVDRAPRRWYTPVAACAVLTAGLVADGLVLFTGILPVLGVAAARIYLARLRHRRPWRDARFDLALGGAAALAIWLARTALMMIATRGGFRLWPVAPTLVSSGDLARSVTVTGRGFLLLFGANFLGDRAGLAAALAFAHLAGLALAAWATCATLRRLPRAELATALLAAAIVVTLTAYVFSTRADDLASTRDITAVLPFGAALAGRALAGRLAAARLLPALAVVLAGYLVSLGRVVIQPPAQPPSAVLGRWLAVHHLDDGLAGYWDANITTLDTGGRVALRSVLAHDAQITSDYWEVKADWFNPAVSYANFIVLVPSPPGFNRYPTVASVRRTFGQPLRIYYVNVHRKNYIIVVWNKNLLADLVRGGPLPPRTRSGPTPARPLPVPPGE